MGSRGLSYIVGVLLVLSITIAVIYLYMTTANFQAQTIFNFLSLEAVKASENLVIVEYHRPSDTLVIYNNGQVPTCFVQLTLVGGPTFYNNPSCTTIQPGQYATIVAGLVNPPPKFTILGRTVNNKILVYTII